MAFLGVCAWHFETLPQGFKNRIFTTFFVRASGFRISK
jgi:hypothetical protein